MKELEMHNGRVVDADPEDCTHDILKRPGATPVCWRCGKRFPDEDDEDDDG